MYERLLLWGQPAFAGRYAKSYTCSNESSAPVSEDFFSLLMGFARLINVAASQSSLSGGEEWRRSGQTLLIKAYRHLESLGRLSRGVPSTPWNASSSVYIDHASVAVLARAVFEAYILFHYIFVDGTADDQLFRYRVWKLSGLIERGRMAGISRIAAERQRILDEDRLEIDDCLVHIRSDKRYLDLGKAAQKKVEHGDFKMGKRFSELAQRAGLPRKYAADAYNHFCEYAHSGPVSTYQIEDAMVDKGGHKLAGFALSFCSILTSQIIRNYAALLPEVYAALKSEQPLLDLLARWHFMTEAVEGMFAESPYSPYSSDKR
jgi:hypothetical protein